MYQQAEILQQLKASKIALFGLGLTGMSMFRYLQKHDIKPDVFDGKFEAASSAKNSELFDGLNTQFGNITDTQFNGYEYLLISPGISLTTPAISNAIKNGVQVFCDVELFAQVNVKPVLAVTGSNGKSTVVAWLTDFLNRVGKKAVVCGNFGVPVLDVIDQAVDVFVIELSSFQLDTTESLKCEAATVLNVSPDHLDRYESFEDYAASKRKIYKHAKLEIYNANDELTWNQSEHAQSFGLEKGDWQYVPDRQNLCQNGQVIADFSTFALAGHHNGLNAVSVLALASAVGIDAKSNIDSLSVFSGLTHRCQFVVELNNVKFIDDSKATNIASCQAAINGLAANKNVILIAGGDAKGAELSELSLDIQNHVKHVVALGKDKQQFVQFVDDSSLTLVESMPEAVQKAYAQSKPGDIVLLSPACASIDMFSNYQARAAAFIDAIHHLSSGDAHE
ncbi:UDP-N-acetylmuramoyl-L-alanine--D-glutamate ligase [Psychrosphaera haliotis]|uniref:UDP-N-acetylmuramoyl-L-alanine--D-glutamate ligase n=1 Tax=Psychrosphaera haliotis TaxID=555083 RepID=UPI0031DCC274